MKYLILLLLIASKSLALTPTPSETPTQTPTLTALPGTPIPTPASGCHYFIPSDNGDRVDFIPHGCTLANSWQCVNTDDEDTSYVDAPNNSD